MDGILDTRTIMKTLGERIRDRRIKLGLSLEDVAIRSATSIDLIKQLEWSMLNDIEFTTLMSIAKAVEQNPSDLLMDVKFNEQPNNELFADVTSNEQSTNEVLKDAKFNEPNTSDYQVTSRTNIDQPFSGSMQPGLEQAGGND